MTGGRCEVAIAGNGGFGSALAVLAHRRGHAVRLWGHDRAYTAEIREKRENPRYLPGHRLPAAIEVGSDARELIAGAEVLLSVVPTQYLRAVLAVVGAAVPAGIPVVSCSKGIEQETGLLPTEILEGELGDRPLFVLSGPCHAEELVMGKPATVVLAGEDGEVLRGLQERLSGPSFRLYRSDDRLGVELGAALKNVIAIAAGIVDGLGLGDNAKAALLTRGMAEMARYGVARGARRETFFGLAGIGDLITTSISPHGRNRSLGERLGRGETLDDILATTRKVSEGVWTCKALCAGAARLGVELPIAEAVASVLFEGRAPADAAEELMTRLLRDEA